MTETYHQQTSISSSKSVLADPELFIRPSWVNATVAHKAVLKGYARPGSCALSLWVRSRLQEQLFYLGCFIQRHCGKVLFLGLLALSLCCIGLKTASMETDVDKLWVEEGGRLHKELEYTQKILGEGSGTTPELIIQTPKHGENILSVDSMQLHLRALQAAVDVQVDMYDVTWKFHDICLTTSFPSFDNVLMDMILPKLVPCVVITPLDCFWEGSKLLGPDSPVIVPYLGQMDWTNLNPKLMVDNIEKMLSRSAIGPIKELLERAGITSGYQEKPCLNPHDPKCPSLAPNKKKNVPNIGAALTGGCKGFATRFMHWPEDLIVGGVAKNSSGYITKAEALQSILQLMGEKQLYELYQDDYKVHSIDWSMAKAKTVLQAWQRKFSSEIQRVMKEDEGSAADSVYPFSSTSLLDILTEFSQVSVVRVALGYVLMVIYACVSLLRWNDAVRSQAGIGVAGVLLVILSVAAGLGICSVIGIKFNASTTQILPFLALGLGVDDMFLLAHGFEEITQTPTPYMSQTGECLRRTGVSVVLTSLINMSAFFLAALIPIPALKAFVLQAGLLMSVNLCAMMLVYPAIVSFDLMRRQEGRIDVFCCFMGRTGQEDNNKTSIEEGQQGRTSSGAPSTTTSSTTFPVEPPPYVSPIASPSPPPTYTETVAQTQADGTNPVTRVLPPTPTTPGLLPWLSTGGRRPARNAVHPEPLPSSNPPSTASSQQCLAPTSSSSSRQPRSCGSCSSRCSIAGFARNVYGPLLSRTPVKVLILVSFVVVIIASSLGAIKVKDGLELTDLVPQHTTEYNFLSVQKSYFGFYHFYAVTKADFDYPNGQQALHDYHRSFRWIDKIIKREDGTLPDYWLQLMREWLMDVQRAFDNDKAAGCFGKDTWYHNASDNAILGFKLMVQTGDIDNPVDKSRITTGRLVDSAGIIYPPAFYNLLTAWVFNDALAYAASQADFMPWPDQSKEWVHEPMERVLEIPKWQPLTLAKFPFYLNNMVDTSEIVATIVAIRNICDTALADTGLPNYPSGVPFTFWEQYVSLRWYLSMCLLSVLSVVFLIVSLVLLNPWSGLMVLVSLGLILLQLFGLMGWMGIKLSAVPAVILVVAVGVGVPFVMHFVLGFVTCLGDRNTRMRLCLEKRLAPVIHAAVSTLLGLILLVGAEFDFIVKYFFVVLTGLLLIGLLNGTVLLPVLLSIIGPPAEVIPTDDPNVFRPPTPEPSPKPVPRHHHHHHHYRHGNPYHPSSSRHHRSLPGVPGRRSGGPGGVSFHGGDFHGVPGGSEISLSTISEEPTQYDDNTTQYEQNTGGGGGGSGPTGGGYSTSAHEITFCPEVVLETSMPGHTSEYSSSGNANSTSSSGNNSTESSPPESATSTPPSPPRHPHHFTTKVRATATVKVELHHHHHPHQQQQPQYSQQQTQYSQSQPQSQYSQPQYSRPQYSTRTQHSSRGQPQYPQYHSSYNSNHRGGGGGGAGGGGEKKESMSADQYMYPKKIRRKTRPRPPKPPTPPVDTVVRFSKGGGGGGGGDCGSDSDATATINESYS